MAKHHSIRRFANPSRVSQRVWTVLRVAGGPMSTSEIAATAVASTDTTKHLLRRWRREGLVSVVSQIDQTEPLQSSFQWHLERDLGPLAPILRQRILTGQGFTDPNTGSASVPSW